MKSKYMTFIIFTCVSGILCQVYKASSSNNNSNNNNNNSNSSSDNKNSDNHVAEVVEKPAEAVEPIKNDLITQTVYGFLDFTTTIGNTVMVFSPNSAPAEGEKKTTSSPITTKPTTTKKIDIQPSKIHKNNNNEESKKSKNTKVIVNSSVQSKNEPKIEATKSPVLSSVVQVRAKDETAVKNNLAEPEYDFLSKQPAEIVDETYKVINLSPSSKPSPKPRPTSKKERENPTGLVTKLGGTIVKDGLTTVHETSVIGTYINGKYAQVLQSTSRILKPGTPALPDLKIRPSNAQKILKTIGPAHGKYKTQLEPTPSMPGESSLPLEELFSAPSGSSVKVTRRPSANHAPRPKYRNKIIDDQDSYEGTPQGRSYEKNRPTTSRPNYKNRPQTTTTSTTTTEAPARRRTSFRPATSPQSSGKLSHRSKSDQSPVILPKSKLPRTQGRWAYKPAPKARVAIRKQVEDEEKVTESVVTNEPTTSVITSSSLAEEKPTVAAKKTDENISDAELDSSESEQVSSSSGSGSANSPGSVSANDQNDNEAIIPAETINVEISTPADMTDMYYLIATIKSPYTYQVGTMKNTRFITVTSTQKKSFATADPSTTSTSTEPLTENILGNTAAAYESSLPLDSSIATLPAITLESGQMTPPLETLTETFTTTQTLLKTYLLPVVANGNTTRHTLVQTYNIARMVTAIKTLPPSEIYQFIPSKTLNEFNSKLDEAGSELHLELDFGEDENDDEDIPKRVLSPNANEQDLEAFKSPGKSPSGTKPEAPSPSPEPQLLPESAQHLALLNYFNQAAQVITTSRPVVVLETLYESHVIPLISNGNTVFSTLSRPVGTVPRTSYEVGTSTIAPIPPTIQQIPQIPQQIPHQVPQVPLYPPQPQFTVTTAPLVTQTVATISDSRVLKLTFGAKTAYTTLFSTRVVPTEITTYVTTTVAVQPTVPAFPGFFGSPVGYPAFPYVG
ncbi:mucin-2 [Microplitis mediator]|uniref:mucin-2 n=1 Tax=Microplitis mediator TaxID=375433 RepID=UPI002552D129|nr:mucin-2 [Microplitis mediator]